MNIEKLKYIYLVGIGGIGMSALARYFSQKGKVVSGYDRVQTSLTKKLQDEGIHVVYKDEESEIENQFQFSSLAEFTPEEYLVIYTPAIPEENKILNYFQWSLVEVCKRAKVLARISEQTTSLAVAGTHGKTTTASILAHVMDRSALGCNAFLGGIANNFNSNLVVNEDSKITVLEADEYDRSFLNLSPNIAIITSMDPDHLDIYNKADDFHKGFLEFVGRIDPEGMLVYHYSLKKFFENRNEPSVSYGAHSGADVSASNIRVEQGVFTFDINFQNSICQDVKLSLPGKHNVENALAAATVALSLGVSLEEVRHSLSTFSGVYRRFQYKYANEGKFYIDDYAHHPTEIAAIIEAARVLFPNKKISCVFQPHLYSRTRDFMNEFAEVLSKFDEIILLDIYPAREMPIEGVNSESLLAMITNANKSLFAKEEVCNHIIDKELEVLFTLGAGDIDTLVGPITNHFNEKYNIVRSRD